MINFLCIVVTELVTSGTQCNPVALGLHWHCLETSSNWSLIDRPYTFSNLYRQFQKKKNFFLKSKYQKRWYLNHLNFIVRLLMTVFFYSVSYVYFQILIFQYWQHFMIQRSTESEDSIYCSRLWIIELEMVITAWRAEVKDIIVLRCSLCRRISA